MASTRDNIRLQPTLYNPDELTNLAINEVGQEYLDEREREKLSICSFFLSICHRNSSVAKRLQAYDENSTTYEKWQFLADNYATLASSRGNLGDAILALFEQAFLRNQKSNYHIALYCLINRGYVDENKLYFDHEDSEDRSPNKISYALKIIIANYYIKEMLNNHSNKNRPDKYSPSTAIDDEVFADYKNVKEKVNSPDDLTKGLVNQLGLIYLTKHPEKILFHASQPIALELRQYDGNNDAYTCWIKLIDAYAKLTDSRGELAMAVLSLFECAFKTSVFTYVKEYVGRGQSMSVSYNPAYLAKALKGIVNLHFEFKYRAGLEKRVSLDM